MLVEQRHATSDPATTGLVRQSDAALAAKRPEAAETLAREAMDRDDAYVPARLALGRALEAQGQHAEAAATYAEAARMSALSAGVRSSLRRVWIAPVAGFGIVYGVAIIIFRELGRRFDQRTVLFSLLLITTALLLWTLIVLLRRRRRFSSLSKDDRRVLELHGRGGLFGASTPVRLLFVGALIVLLSGAVLVFAVGTKPSLDMRVGDCFSIDHEGSIQTIAAIPCNLPHGNEVVGVVRDPAPAGAPYPGIEVVRNAATPGCESAYQEYIGAPYVRSARWWIAILSPEESYWVIGVRDNWCTVMSVRGGQTLGSARGSGN